MDGTVPPRHLLLFGDYSIERLPAIKTLAQQAKIVPAAERFLREITDVIQLEFSRTDRAVHGWDKGLASLLEMAEAVDSAGSNSNLAAATALLCAARLGQLIVYADADPAILGSAAQPVDVIGFCGGLLPAAVAMAAQDTSELFALGREIVSISFRLACEISQRKRLVDDAPSSWGKTYIGLQTDHVQDILDKFHESQGIPSFRRITIGVVAKDWLTLVGPPSSMAMLTSWSPEIQATPSIDSDVGGPMHSCWSPRVNTARILGNSALLRRPLDPVKARMISPGGGPCAKYYDHPTLGSMLEEMIDDIAHKPLHITSTIQETVSGLQRRDRQHHVRLSVMGPTNHQAATTHALKSCGIKYEINSLDRTWNKETSPEQPLNVKGRGGSGLVAIVGMAGRFPGSDTVEGFWEDLLDGKCHIKEIPPSRFDISAHFDPTGAKLNSTTARHGAFLSSPGLFDHRLFNVSPREASQMDPCQRLLLTASYEALQSAGYHPSAGLTAGGARVATYFGQAADEWRELLNQQGADIYYVPGFSRAFAPSRVHHHFQFGGGSFALDAACATSAAAVAMAANALVARECDMALAGGANVLVSPTTYSGLSRAGMLSTTGGCRTFHDDADGYARGEGVGVVVLKRLEDAVSDNDRVLAVVKGAVRAYGVGAQSMTRPCATAQEMAYRRMLRQACMDPEELVFVEMHGTGTQAGDVEEINSVVGTLVGKRGRDNSLTVGAVKAAVGHGEGAAGITSLIKVIMMLRERQIPPQPGWPFQPNKKFPDLSKAGIRIPIKPAALAPSPKGDGKIKLAVNSFDASGGNVSIAVEEAPKPPVKMADSRPWHVVTVSARTPASLRQNRQRLLSFLESHPETKLPDLAYTTTARRMHEQLRRAYVGDTMASIVRQLRSDDVVDNQEDGAPQARKPRVPSRVFLFTGQGSHYAGMGAVLFRTSRQFRDTVLSYQDMTSAAGLPQFVHLISDEEEALADTEQQSTAKMQLAIVALEIAMARLMGAWGITPTVVIGHSLGEYAALCVAGVLSVSDALLLVGERARLMEKHLAADTYAMLAVSTTEEKLVERIETLALSSCTIACANAPSLTVASGTVGDVEALRSALESEGQRATLLRVPYGFHSSQVDPILDDFVRVARGVHFSDPKIPVVSTLLGQVALDRMPEPFSPAYLARQAREKVNFCGAVKAAVEAGLCAGGGQSLWLEMGPDPVCIGLVRRCLDDIPTSCLLPTLKQGKDNWATLSDLLKRAYESGINVSWPEIHKPFTNSLTLLDLPTYAFDSREFWTPYKTPYPTSPLSQPIAANASRRFPTTTLQEIRSEKIEGNAKIVEFTSRVSDEHLLEAIRGHVVGGFEICPLAVFQDIALSAAEYLFHNTHGSSAALPKMSIRRVELNQGLVIEHETAPNVLLHVIGSYRSANAVVDVEFSSTYDDKKTTLHHGKCQVVFDDDASWKAGLPQTLYLVKSRLESLQEQARSGKARRLPKQAAYELFSGVVSYAAPYQALQEVIMGVDCTDAVGTARLADLSARGTFHVSPYWIDAVTHLAGFVLNCGLRYPEDIACLAVGFDAWHPLKDLKAGETYTVYACLQDVTDGAGRGHEVRGDCYVFAGAGMELCQATLGIKFLRMKKVALNMILGGSGGGRTLGAGRSSGSEMAQTKGQNVSAAAAPNHSETSKKLDMEEIAHISGAQINTVKTGAESPVRDPREMIVRAMIDIIANESGCSADELNDESRYADLGIDSVMAINILAQLSNDLDLNLPAAFFLENETIGDSKESLLAHLGDNATMEDDTAIDRETRTTSFISSTGASTDTTAPSTPTPEPLDLAKLDESSEKEEGSSDNKFTAQVVHYQGPRTADARKIFFLAEETGSTFGYIALPPLGSGLGVYGVDLHSINEIDATDLNPEMLVRASLDAIRDEQPSGPYLLGGTSDGAILAFGVARSLLEAGEEVYGLLILDCAAPAAFTSAGSTDYRLAPLAPTSQPKLALQVLPRQDGPPDTYERQQQPACGWADLIPNLEVYQSDIESSMFLDFSMIDSLGHICKSAVERMLARGG